MRNVTLAIAAAAMAVPAIPVFTPSADAHVVNGSRNHRHCRRANGTVGMVVGGAAGALVGREIAGRRHRTTGTIVGAAGGALAGRAIARGRVRCR
ncbi:MAG TPA: glycine zipper 2TM domain-containing protein [Allosphingosinicella sp.]|jgi:uncharacterized protein YcfJ